MSRPVEIVVVDDEPDLREMLVDYLGGQALAVRAAADGADLDALLAERPADLLVLDVNMPGEDGFSVARRLRAEGSRVGIVMLTAAGALPQRLTGLDGGADDYLTKPFELRELLARIRSVLRRLEAERPPPEPPERRRARVGRCTLDLDARTLVDAAGGEVPLTAMEYDLLVTFVRHPRQVLTREQIVRYAHNRTIEPQDRSVDIRITRLRQKLEVDPAQPTCIRTVRGEGYLYEPGG